MAKIKLLISVAGTPSGIPGDVVEVDEQEAQRFVEAGFAELIEDEKEKKGKK